MINVCFAGITGWTAAPIVAGIAAADDLSLVAGVARSAAGRPIRDSVDVDADGQIFGSVAEALQAVKADVLVDYTSAAAVRGDVEAAIAAGVHAVVGSSGLTAGDYDRLDHLARARSVGVFAAGNFSVMAAVLKHAATMAAAHLPHWEIIDFADLHKSDAPSGTSRELAEALGHVPRPGGGDPAGAADADDLARGIAVGGTRIHSVRLPSFVVTTEVVFAGSGERLTMRHDPGPSPQPYVDGTLLAIRRVAEVPGVRRGLDTLLFEDGKPGR